MIKFELPGHKNALILQNGSIGWNWNLSQSMLNYSGCSGNTTTTHTNSKLHDRGEIEQNLENKD